MDNIMIRNWKSIDSRIKVWIYILIMFFSSRLIMYLLFVSEFHSYNIIDCIKQYNDWDAGWYLGYVSNIFDGNFSIDYNTGQAAWAFFPLYPLVVGVVWIITGKIFDICVLGSVLSSIFFMISEYYAYKYVMLTRKNNNIAYVYIFFMSFGVYSFYFSILYTESLFLLLLTMCFYYLKKKNYIKMGICGLLMSATRNVGIMFVFVILIYLIRQYIKKNRKLNIFDFIVSNLKNEKLILGTCMIPLGLFSYMFYLHRKLGDGLAFVHVQNMWGRQTVGIIHNLKEAFWETFPPTYLGVVFLIIVVFIIYKILVDKQFDELIFPIIVLILSASSMFVSIPRFIVASFTVVLGISEEYCKQSKVVKILSTLLIVLFELILIKAWLNHNGLLC